MLGDLLEEPGQQVAEQIRAAGGDVVFVRLDVTSEADWERALAVALDRYGQLNVLVNNAGIPLRRTLEQTTEQEWDHVLAVRSSKARSSAPRWRSRSCGGGGGSIINMSSVSGIIASTGAAYGASERGAGA